MSLPFQMLALDVSWLFGHWIWPILLFLLGLGVVVFIHELGHYIAARAVGIKVERFAIGMGPRLVGFKRGETDYCICAVPLGGYVKMLGQEDFRGLEDGEAKPDPGSFQAKSVGARFLVISAGVVMNVIGAAVMFIVLGQLGTMRWPVATVGGVEPGYPAAEARIRWDTPLPPTEEGGEPRQTTSGLKPGDDIVAVNGNETRRFDRVKITAILSEPDEMHTLRIRRRVEGKAYEGTAKVGVKRAPSFTGSGGTMLSMGIVQASSLEFQQPEGVRVLGLVESGDVLVAVDGRRMDHSWQVDEWEKSLLPRPPDAPLPSQVTLTVRRDGKEVDVVVPIALSMDGDALFLKTTGQMLLVEQEDRRSEGEQTTLTPSGGEPMTVDSDQVIDPSPLDILGMTPRLRILKVIEDSPAAEAGLQPGDIVLSYGDEYLPTIERFLEINEEFVDIETNIQVLRDGKQQPIMQITPESKGGRALTGVHPGLDCAHAAVAAIRPGSLADKKEIRSGDRIVAANDQPVEGWVDLFNAVRGAQARQEELTLTVRRGQEEVPIAFGKIHLSDLDPAGYRAELTPGLPPRKPLLGPPLKLGPFAAIAWGLEEVAFNVVAQYATLRSLITGTVSTKEATGPVGIGAIAVETGREGLDRFVYFMAFISVALAVVNFLPIPVLDGGHAALLIYEKIRGKPAPLKVQNALQYAGLALLLTLIILVTWQDISRLVGNVW